jgi:Sensors of blue-light using FAD
VLQLTYISTVVPNFVDSDLFSILESSRRNNRATGLTGMLLFDGRRFLQHLEGEDAAVTHAYARIKSDHRHCAVVKLTCRHADKRVFSGWDMAFERPRWAGPVQAPLEDQVAAMVKDVDPGVAAHFTSFSMIRSRRAA